MISRSRGNPTKENTSNRRRGVFPGFEHSDDSPEIGCNKIHRLVKHFANFFAENAKISRFLKENALNSHSSYEKTRGEKSAGL
jgi:hypothetical protein